MANTVRLRHGAFGGDWTEYFYDGRLPVINQVIELPINRPEWIRRAWVLGFRQTVDGLPVDDLEAHVRREQARDAKEMDANEGADAGGLPDVEDGVRSSEQESSPRVPKRRVVRRKRNSAGARA